MTAGKLITDTDTSSPYQKLKFYIVLQAQVSCTMTGSPYYWVACSFDASNNITAVSEVSTPA